MLRDNKMKRIWLEKGYIIIRTKFKYLAFTQKELTNAENRYKKEVKK